MELRKKRRKMGRSYKKIRSGCAWLIRISGVFHKNQSRMPPWRFHFRHKKARRRFLGKIFGSLVFEECALMCGLELQRVEESFITTFTLNNSASTSTWTARHSKFENCRLFVSARTYCPEQCTAIDGLRFWVNNLLD